MLTGLLISHFSTLKAMIFSTEAEINAIHEWHRACGETPWGKARASRPRKARRRSGAEA